MYLFSFFIKALQTNWFHVRKWIKLVNFLTQNCRGYWFFRSGKPSNYFGMSELQISEPSD